MPKMNRNAKKIFANPFLNYLKDFRREMQGQNVSVTRLCQLAGQRWREMTPEQRMPYIQLAEKARKIEKRKRGSGKPLRESAQVRRGKRAASPYDGNGSGRRKKRASESSGSQSYSSETSASSNG